jgi:hypothetical protein
MGKTGKTAAEFLEELSKDKGYQAREKARQKKMESRRERLRDNEKPLIEALSEVGVVVSSVWDLVNTGESYQEAMPVLVSHLQKEYHPKVLAGIARALAVPDTNNIQGAWDVLFELYKSTAPEEKIKEPELRGFKDGLAVALSVLCNSERVKDVLTLINDKWHGESRGLLIDGLSKFKGNIEIKNFLEPFLKNKKLGEISRIVYKRI